MNATCVPELLQVRWLSRPLMDVHTCGIIQERSLLTRPDADEIVEALAELGLSPTLKHIIVKDVVDTHDRNGGTMLRVRCRRCGRVWWMRSRKYRLGKNACACRKYKSYEYSGQGDPTFA